MPTAGRLVAAVLFGPLCWLASVLALPYYPLAEATPPDWFAEVNAGLGVILGWKIAGGRAGLGSWAGAISYGLTAGVAISVAALFVHSFVQMVQLSLRKVYDGPADAVIGVFALMFENAQVVAQQDVGVVIIGGSLVAGLVVEWFGRNFR